MRKDLEEVVFNVLNDKDSKVYTSNDDLNVYERVLFCSKEILEKDKKLTEIEYELLRGIVRYSVDLRKKYITSELNKKFELWITDFTLLLPVTVNNKEFLHLLSDEEIKTILKNGVDEMIVERN